MLLASELLPWMRPALRLLLVAPSYTSSHSASWNAAALAALVRLVL
ncbi:hypothetical protein R5W23_002135 [Gemmata sp. JC673]|uniref:Uncharacterized protein n=1 Tax=Gemmata algarum TaxID=2975278 RepID=A0ABU5F002_9BACT|nr:hypothetical protein [Gemmata algarum]MDY3560886.1 hypothetical protein [Gemmata algarum]